MCMYIYIYIYIYIHIYIYIYTIQFAADNRRVARGFPAPTTEGGRPGTQEEQRVAM